MPSVNYYANVSLNRLILRRFASAADMVMLVHVPP
jgi:hypothetical protein